MGKKLSLASKTIAVLMVLLIYIIYSIMTEKLPTASEAAGLIQAGIFIALVFSPVDISMITRNIKDSEK